MFNNLCVLSEMEHRILHSNNPEQHMPYILVNTKGLSSLLTLCSDKLRKYVFYSLSAGCRRKGYPVTK